MILVAVTNRASYPRCKTLISALGKEAESTGQVSPARVLLMNPEPEIEYELDDIAIVSRSRVYGDCQAMTSTTGHLMADAALILGMEKPAAVVVVGDRHEVLAVAAAARIMNTPLVHLLAGERSGSVDDDIRFSVSALASLCLAPHDVAKEELLRHGVIEERIVVSGCPSIDLCAAPYRDLNELYVYGHGSVDVTQPFWMACLHPDTNLSLAGNSWEIERLASLMADKPTIWIRPTQHDAYGREMDKRLSQLSVGKPWLVVRHIPSALMLSALNSCVAMAGNSSVMWREAAYMGVPCYAVGNRQSGRMYGVNNVSLLPTIKSRFPSDTRWAPGGGARAAKAILNLCNL